MTFSNLVRLLVFPVAFLTIGIFLSRSGSLYLLVIGFVLGLLIIRLTIPGLLRQWKNTGIPGTQKTSEQQEIWEQEKTQRGIRKNLSILLAVFFAAVIRIYFREYFNDIVVILFGVLAGYFLGFGWIIYQKRGKLGPPDT